MKYQLQLIDMETITSPPPTLEGMPPTVYPEPADYERDCAVRDEIANAAMIHGLEANRERKTEREPHRQSVGKSHHFGGMPPEVTQIVEIATYAAGSIAAFTVFVRNVLGSLKDWRDLRDGRKIAVTVGGRKIELKDGDDLLKVIEDHAKAEGKR